MCGFSSFEFCSYVCPIPSVSWRYRNIYRYLVIILVVVVLSEYGIEPKETQCQKKFRFGASHRGHLLRAEVNRNELVELGAERLHLVRLEHALCVH
eukprot:COSAG06_NODE_1961_length_7974_cov_43.011808_3_plen_96_part_00